MPLVAVARVPCSKRDAASNASFSIPLSSLWCFSASSQYSVQQFDNRFNRKQAYLLRGWWRRHQHIGFTFFVLLCAIALCVTGCGTFPNTQTTASPNNPVVQQAPKARITYVAIGASDTYGIGTDDPQTQSWPADLSTKLGDGVHLVNLGIPGVHADSALNVEVPIALDNHPDIVTIWLAVNDLADGVSLSTYTQSLDSILTRLQTLTPHTRIAVANVPDITSLPRFQSQNAQVLHERITAYNTVIASLVQKHHALLVDLYTRWQDLANHPDYISNDGFHPNAFGYAAIATIFYQVLQENAK